ncbi:hypothetical protein [Gryllotalpicola protaetiae]|uniref:hypothetical protein n=1 Tax=Gryllotalpicola protaetiae TaxID=2419771 RepID=UPI0013C47242|nr:hypothetical protein [Gryllotalpicola protaetiae]
MKLSHRLAAVILATTLAVAGALAGAGAAQAAGVGGSQVAASVVVAAPAPVTQASGDVDTTTTCSADTHTEVVDGKTKCYYLDPYFVQFLPINRWSSFTASIHTNFSNVVSSVVANASVTTPQVWGATIGDWSYRTAADLVSLATSMQPLNLLGAKADNIVGVIGSALFDSTGKTFSVIAALVIIMVVAAVWRMRKDGLVALKKLIPVAVALGIFTTMIGGATQSTTTDGVFNPGFMSPGWVVQKASTVINGATSLPAAGVLAAQGGTIERTVAPTGSNCAAEIKSLDSDFANGLDGTQQNADLGAVAQGVNDLWLESGLASYFTMQGGSSTETPDTDRTWVSEAGCVMLDQQSSVPPAQIAAAFTGGNMNLIGDTADTKNHKINTNSAAWYVDQTNNTEVDEDWIAWAACQVTENKAGNGFDISVRPAFSKVTGGDQACADWWDTDGPDAPTKNKTWAEIQRLGNALNNVESLGINGAIDDALGNPDSPALDAFKIGGSTGAVNSNFPLNPASYPDGEPEKAGTPDQFLAEVQSARTFVSTLHGGSWSGSADGLAAAGSFGLSGLVVLFGLGGLALAVALAKLGTVVMILALAGVMLRVMIRPESGGAVIAKFGKRALGGMILAWASSFALALVVAVSTLISSLGNQLFPTASPLSIAWVGASPAIALFLLNWLLKSIGQPGIFRPSDAMNWGTSASGIGGAAASWVQSYIGKARQAEGRSLLDGAKSIHAGAATGVAGAQNGLRLLRGQSEQRKNMMTPATGGPKAKPTDDPRPKPGPAGDEPKPGPGPMPGPGPKPGPKPGPAAAGAKAASAGTRDVSGAWVMGSARFPAVDGPAPRHRVAPGVGRARDLSFALGTTGAQKLQTVVTYGAVASTGASAIKADLPVADRLAAQRGAQHAAQQSRSAKTETGTPVTPTPAPASARSAQTPAAQRPRFQPQPPLIPLRPANQPRASQNLHGGRR